MRRGYWGLIMDLPSFIIALGQLFNQFVAIIAWPAVAAFLIFAIRDPLRDIVARLTHGRASPVRPASSATAADAQNAAGTGSGLGDA